MDRHATTLSLAHLSAEPGTRTFGMVAVDLGATTVEIPIVLVNGATAGPRVGVTAGIHGAEYVSIAALRRVAMSVDPATMSGTLVASLISNPAAYAARTIYVDPSTVATSTARSRRSRRWSDRAPRGLAARDGHRTLRPVYRLPLRRHERGPRLICRSRAHRRCGRRCRDRGDGRGVWARLDRGRATARVGRRPQPRSASRPCSAKSAGRASGRRLTWRSTKPGFVGSARGRPRSPTCTRGAATRDTALRHRCLAPGRRRGLLDAGGRRR